MKKKITAVLMALAATLGLAVVASPPAQSYVGSTQCVAARDWSVCAYPSFVRQADGSGIRATGFNIWTNVGCGSLEATPFNPIEWSLANPSGTRLGAGYTYSTTCSFSDTLAFNGPDTGYASFTLSIKVRDNWATDRMVYYVWDLYPSGNSALRGKGSYEV